jgi:hypothetical protein
VNPALQRSSAVEGASISDRLGAVSRRPTAAVQGLTKAAARPRLSQRGGAATISASRSYASIIRANVLTVFNLIRRAVAWLRCSSAIGETPCFSESW